MKSCISTSTHNVGLQRSASRPTTKTDYLNIVPKSPQVPSIPTKFQSFGYEEDEDGLLIRQAPLKPGYLGTRDDSAGPGDYDPDIKGGKFNKSHGVTFSKVINKPHVLLYYFLLLCNTLVCDIINKYVCIYNYIHILGSR